MKYITDDELVEALLDVGMEFGFKVCKLTPSTDAKEERKEAMVEIRKLLSARSVTREEIDEVVENMWNINAPLKSEFFKENEIRLISELFKSKGIPVRGEK